MIKQVGKFFYLSGKDVSYVMALTETGELIHTYFGKKIRVNENYNAGFEVDKEHWNIEKNSVDIHEANASEYPGYGYPDLHTPAYEVENSFGNCISNILYKSHKIYDGTSEIDGMPSLFAGNSSVQTLEITMSDEIIGLEVVLIYTVYDEYNIIARSVKMKNTSDKIITIDSAYSGCIELKAGNYDVIYFSGTWAREREMIRTNLQQGIHIDISNTHGISGHEMNPFVMIAADGADEDNGNVYSMSLIYSGNHSTFVDCDQYRTIRMRQGINPLQFKWELKNGESFDTPQTVMCFSDCGIGGISRELSKVYMNNLCRSKWTHKERPILINNWEGTYFDFDEEKLLNIARKAKEVGVELFVLDDGWFGKRDLDNCSLGDWVVDTRKLPNGIKGLCEKINDMGLKFGLWFEPEMVNPDSDLYRAHPDWAIQVPERTIIQMRNQYVLDISRNDVCEYIIEAVSKVLEESNIEYVKWDMNRPVLNMPEKGYSHKYVLGYYKIMSAITERFPEILFEGCAGGGGRFDAGVLAYMPQIWTSDNSDAISRLKIQYSTSIAYPVSAISAHVTVAPNHQVARITPLKSRADVAAVGAFGYELDITKMNDEEIEIIKEQIINEKKLRKLIIDCDFYRMSDPFNENYCAWSMVSKNKNEVFAMTCRVLKAVRTERSYILKFKGLDPDADYREETSGEIYGGDTLMYRGIMPVFDNGDFTTATYHFTRV